MAPVVRVHRLATKYNMDTWMCGGLFAIIGVVCLRTGTQGDVLCCVFQDRVCCGEAADQLDVSVHVRLLEGDSLQFHAIYMIGGNT